MATYEQWRAFKTKWTLLSSKVINEDEPLDPKTEMELLEAKMHPSLKKKMHRESAEREVKEAWVQVRGLEVIDLSNLAERRIWLSDVKDRLAGIPFKRTRARNHGSYVLLFEDHGDASEAVSLLRQQRGLTANPWRFQLDLSEIFEFLEREVKLRDNIKAQESLAKTTILPSKDKENTAKDYKDRKAKGRVNQVASEAPEEVHYVGKPNKDNPITNKDSPYCKACWFWGLKKEHKWVDCKRQCTRCLKHSPKALYRQKSHTAKECWFMYDGKDRGEPPSGSPIIGPRD